MNHSSRNQHCIFSIRALKTMIFGFLQNVSLQLIAQIFIPCLKEKRNHIIGISFSLWSIFGFNLSHRYLIQGFCAILFFDKYTYFGSFWYLSLLSMWKYTYFQPKWLKRQKLGNIWRNCCNLWSFLIFQGFFAHFLTWNHLFCLKLNKS